jgi:hypothetical protein
LGKKKQKAKREKLKKKEKSKKKKRNALWINVIIHRALGVGEQ